MAGFKIWTDLDPDRTYRLCRDVAEQLDYAVRPLGDRAFSAQKGSLAATILVGLLAPYCDFQVFVEDLKGETEVRIERNSLWWTGLIGANRVKNRARELATASADRIKEEGGKVLREKEF